MNDFKLAVEPIIELLVARRYNEVVTLTQGRRLDSEAIVRAISCYGRKLASPPESAYDRLDIVRVSMAAVPTWSVRMNLWTVEEGMSDLSIELCLTQSGDGYLVELEDIHVL